MNISKAPIFKLSIASSVLLFFSKMYGQKFWTELWMIYGFIELMIVVFFLIVFVASIVFWIKNKKKFANPFIPFAFNLIVGALVVILPLNLIRNEMGFTLFYNNYEAASNLAIASKHDSTIYFYVLPDKFKSLSLNDGEVSVINKPSAKAVFFFTFIGVPTGKQGFLKIIAGGKPNNFVDDLFSKVYEVKALKNNWYYVAGD